MTDECLTTIQSAREKLIQAETDLLASHRRLQLQEFRNQNEEIISFMKSSQGVFLSPKVFWWWAGISSDFKISLTSSRTQQLCDAMTVSKDLMANLLLAAGGRGGIGTGGGGSTSELTNWDGTKKNTGWGI